MNQVSLIRIQLDFPAGLDLGLALQTKKIPTWDNPTGSHAKLRNSSWNPPRHHLIFPHGILCALE